MYNNQNSLKIVTLFTEVLYPMQPNHLYQEPDTAGDLMTVNNFSKEAVASISNHFSSII